MLHTKHVTIMRSYFLKFLFFNFLIIIRTFARKINKIGNIYYKK